MIDEGVGMDKNRWWVSLGGRGRRAHFASANGFPPQVYRVLFEHLTDVLRVEAVLPLAMRAAGPPTQELAWQYLADPLALRLQTLGYAGAVGMGHSLGGVLTLFMAAKYPRLFSALVLMDPVIFPRRILWPMQVLRILRLQSRFPLVQAARRRRRVFSSREAMLAHYQRRSFFARWDVRALEAYVRYGTREREDGRVELAYPPEWEAAIFASVPTDVWRWIPRVTLPVLVLYGEHSNTFRRPALRRLRRNWPHARFVPIPDAGHMVPVERPEETAAAIRDLVRQLPPIHSSNKMTGS